METHIRYSMFNQTDGGEAKIKCNSDGHFLVNNQEINEVQIKCVYPDVQYDGTTITESFKFDGCHIG